MDEEDDFGFHLVDQEEYAEEQEKKFNFQLESLGPEIQRKLCDMWPPIDHKTILTYPMHKSIEELQRYTPEKQQAHEIGMIRPFLFLVSMHPLTRYSLAKTMKITLEKYQKFGDSHFESWHIIAGHPKKSIQALMQKQGKLSGNWFNLLSHVMKRTMSNSSRVSKPSKQLITQSKALKKQSFRIAQQPNEDSMNALEEVYLISLYEVMESVRKQHKIDDLMPEEWEYTITLSQSEVVDPLVNNLQKYGKFHHLPLMRMLSATALRSRAFHMTENLDEWKEKKQSMELIKKIVRVALPATTIAVNLTLVAASVISLSPIVFVPSLFLALNVSRGFMANDDPLSILLPLSKIISQREVLSYHEISIDEYYVNT